MIALLCGCGRRLEAEGNERLCGRVVDHLERDHKTAHVNHEVVRGMITSRSYRLERVAVYTDGTAPDEEFGLEPY